MLHDRKLNTPTSRIEHLTEFVLCYWYFLWEFIHICEFALLSGAKWLCLKCLNLFALMIYYALVCILWYIINKSIEECWNHFMIHFSKIHNDTKYPSSGTEDFSSQATHSNWCYSPIRNTSWNWCYSLCPEYLPGMYYIHSRHQIMLWFTAFWWHFSQSRHLE